jgi:hypothetical protein
VYSGSKSWSDLQSDAGVRVSPAGPHEVALRRACGRLLHVDDLRRISAYWQFLAHREPPDLQVLSEQDRRLLRMLVGSLVPASEGREKSLGEGAALIWAHPQVPPVSV